jgi:hypothetical protein
MGMFMTQFPEVAHEGYLIASKGLLPANTHNPFFGQNYYVNLYHRASKEVIWNTIKFFESPKTNDYQNFLAVNNGYTYGGSYMYDFREKSESDFDFLKIKDILAQRYVVEGNYEEAIKIYKKFPQKYWKEVFGENPFNLNFYNLSNPFHATQKAFNKLTFLEQLVRFRVEHQKNPKDPYLNYYLANAYFSMTSSGGFWYISQPYNYVSSNNIEAISKNMAKSISYYENVIKYSKDENLVAVASFALKYTNTLKKNLLSKSQQDMLRETASKCDLYNQYLSQIQTDLERKLVHIPVNRTPDSIVFTNSEPVLVNFKDFDVGYY